MNLYPSSQRFRGLLAHIRAPLVLVFLLSFHTIFHFILSPSFYFTTPSSSSSSSASSSSSLNISSRANHCTKMDLFFFVQLQGIIYSLIKTLISTFLNTLFPSVQALSPLPMLPHLSLNLIGKRRGKRIQEQLRRKSS